MPNIYSHIRSISIVLSLVKLYFVFITASIILLGLTTLLAQDITITELIKDDYFPNSTDTPSIWAGTLFLVLIASLNISLIFRLRLASQIIRKYQVGKLLLPGQSNLLKRVGKGFDYYSFLWYATHLIFGVFFFNDLTAFYKTLPYALIFFLLGKVILILSAISSKAEVLKEENDLTV